MNQLFEALRRPRKQGDRKGLVPAFGSRPSRASLTGSILVSLVVSGCNVEPKRSPPTAVVVPQPTARLLARESAPKCTYTDEEPIVATDAVKMAAVEVIQRRERERDCFRDSEQRVRAKLMELQAAVRVMMHATEKQKIASSR